jgi:hypothetical protein
MKLGVGIRVRRLELLDLDPWPFLAGLQIDLTVVVNCGGRGAMEPDQQGALGDGITRWSMIPKGAGWPSA